MWLYPLVRVLVASYIFMTGYGHTFYYLRHGDFSFQRVAKFLIRLNLLSCLLPLVMGTKYQFYYFAPLVSLWFLVVYFTLCIKKAWNSEPYLIFTKISIAAVLTTFFFKVPVALQAVASILLYYHGPDLDAKDWQFRTSLDMFVPYLGMTTAILYSRYLDSSFPLEYSKLLSRTVTLVALFVILVYLFSATQFSSKQAYNLWHPYLSSMPILAFIWLRNCHEGLRKRHSRAFVWLGRCSLETFVLQYHIWLAGKRLFPVYTLNGIRCLVRKVWTQILDLFLDVFH